jgi:hypothetical protein
MEHLEPHIAKAIQARRRRYEVSAAAVGALAGAGMGALVAGPAGVIASAVVGAGIGVGTGWTAEMRAKESSQRDRKFDHEN